MSVFVLVPGAGGDSWYWHLVAARLRARGHEVATPDLPAADEAAGLAAYEQAVVDVIGDRSGVVLAAQSLGAFTAPQVCERVDARLLALVAPMIPVAGETPGAWWSATGQTRAQREQDKADGRDPDAEFDVMNLFMHDVPEDVVAEAFARGEPRQSGTPMGDVWPLSRWPQVPTRVLAARHDRLFPLAFMRRLARDRLGVEADVIDAGHLPALSRPDELTDWLEGIAANPR